MCHRNNDGLFTGGFSVALQLCPNLSSAELLTDTEKLPDSDPPKAWSSSSAGIRPSRNSSSFGRKGRIKQTFFSPLSLLGGHQKWYASCRAFHLDLSPSRSCKSLTGTFVQCREPLDIVMLSRFPGSRASLSDLFLNTRGVSQHCEVYNGRPQSTRTTFKSSLFLNVSFRTFSGCSPSKTNHSSLIRFRYRTCHRFW